MHTHVPEEQPPVGIPPAPSPQPSPGPDPSPAPADPPNDPAPIRAQNEGLSRAVC